MTEYAVSFDCPVCGERVVKASAVIAEGQEHQVGLVFFIRENDRLIGWLFAPCGHGSGTLCWEGGRYSPGEPFFGTMTENGDA